METELYYASYGRKGRDQEREEQLARYWAAAAIPLRHIDPDMAMTCEHKANFWVNPDNFTAAEVKWFGIGLKKVRGQYQALLFPKFASATRPPVPARLRKE